MYEVQNLFSSTKVNLEDKEPLNIYEANDFIISNIINQISNSSQNRIFYITEDSKKCKLIIEYLENTWDKKTFYLSNDILNSHLNDTDGRHRSLNIIHFLTNNNKIKFIEAQSLSSEFNERINKKTIQLIKGSNELDREKLIEKLDTFGYKKTEFTEKLGDYSVRGSIVDIFTPSFALPIRVEFFNDKVSSINTFNIESERRLTEEPERIDVVSITKESNHKKNKFILDHLRESIVLIDCSIEELIKEDIKIKEFVGQNKIIKVNPLIMNTPAYKFKIDYIDDRSIQSLTSLSSFIKEKNNTNKITIVSDEETIKNLKVDLKHINVGYLNGFLRKSFISTDSNEIFISYNRQEGYSDKKINSQKYAKDSFKLSGFNDLKKGELVIHKDYGLCVFNGIKDKIIDGIHVDFIECEFNYKDLLLIPTDRISLIQKYIGSSENKSLDTLRTKAWGGKVKKAKKVAQTTAKEILSLYAQRKSVKGHGFKINYKELTEFEDTFEFEETIDQKNAILDTYNDMKSTTPMDRLICGDVGFGKTEIALRAAFLATMNIKQTVIIAPTTLLAQQHLATFRNRFKDFPIRVEGITRFTKKNELDKIIEDSSSGKVDIIIGTHKIFSKHSFLNNIGLIIVDEEHKFGVSHKEKIKQIKKGIDSLSISATPIPRTLQLSLSGLREISLLATPPKERLSIETYIEEFDMLLVKEAIDFELERNGRVFFIHNEIVGIEKIHREIKKICPHDTTDYIHGRMTGSEVEQKLKDFIDGKIKILITTTIVEAGLDIREANTMIINNAHKFGLSDLYQLRGRIGRGNKKGKAYLLIPKDGISENATKRLSAIRKLTRLGSGFNIAMEDLEIRGAGNLFGTQQSGNIYDVGIEFYLELLENEVNRLRNNSINEDYDVEVVYKKNIYIPSSYIESAERRIFYYKKISLINTKRDYVDLIEELLDKFGAIPAEVQNLANISLIKIECKRIGIKKIIIKESSIVMFCNSIEKLKNAKIEIRNIANDLKQVTQLLENKKNIKEILKSNYEIEDGKFIINNKQIL